MSNEEKLKFIGAILVSFFFFVFNSVMSVSSMRCYPDSVAVQISGAFLLACAMASGILCWRLIVEFIRRMGR